MHWWTAQQLKSKNPQTRMEAIGKMASRSPSEAFEPLLRLVTDPEPSIRKAAIGELGKIHQPPSLHPLVDLLKGENDEAREAAGTILGLIKHHDAPALLLPLLRSPRIPNQDRQAHRTTSGRQRHPRVHNDNQDARERKMEDNRQTRMNATPLK